LSLLLMTHLKELRETNNEHADRRGRTRAFGKPQHNC
jgi:hypothetical protein